MRLRDKPMCFYTTIMNNRHRQKKGVLVCNQCNILGLMQFISKKYRGNMFMLCVEGCNKYVCSGVY